jgi:hypothetical protein
MMSTLMHTLSCSAVLRMRAPRTRTCWWFLAPTGARTVASSIKALHGRAASLIDARFVVVKIDVGNFDKNLDVVKHYGYPTGKGIPAAVVLSPG